MVAIWRPGRSPAVKTITLQRSTARPVLGRSGTWPVARAKNVWGTTARFSRIGWISGAGVRSCKYTSTVEPEQELCQQNEGGKQVAGKLGDSRLGA